MNRGMFLNMEVVSIGTRYAPKQGTLGIFNRCVQGPPLAPVGSHSVDNCMASGCAKV